MGGFTLTEMMIVMFIIALVSMVVINRLPALKDTPTGPALLQDIRSAATLAQLKQVPYRIQIMKGKWELSKLTESSQGEPSSWPGKVWSVVNDRNSRVVHEENTLMGLLAQDTELPVNGEIIFMPDSGSTPLVVVIMKDRRVVDRILSVEGEYVLESVE